MRPSPHAGAASATAPLSRDFRSMAARVRLRVIDAGPDAARALNAARRIFDRVEAACAPFDRSSPLMRANAAGHAWHQVPEDCYLAVVEAARAHRETGGLFDPRVLHSLLSLGYDRTMSVEPGPAASNRRPHRPDAGAGRPWHPDLDPGTRSVRLGPHRIDLGGIGRALAVRLAGLTLAGAGRAHLVEAGGDRHVGGDGVDGDGWRVDVEDPAGGPEPVAVLRVRDTGGATSSLRFRSWLADGAVVHHVIDPRTGRSARGGLLSVTVLEPDPVQAAIWSKALLIAGRDRVAALAAERGLAALWVDDRGRVGCSAGMAPSVPAAMNGSMQSR